MPVLGYEKSMFPENLFEESTDTVEDRQWWVVYTKARQEKALARNLLGHEIPFYLPLVSSSHYNRGRRHKSYLPLFAGYVFLYGTEHERVTSLTSNRISRILPVRDQDQLRDDLRSVRRLIDQDAPLTIESRLAPGQKVRIKNGPFSGLEGTVLERRKKIRLLIAVHYLQQGVSLEIDDFLVEPL